MSLVLTVSVQFSPEVIRQGRATRDPGWEGVLGERRATMAQSGGLGLRASGEDPQKFILEWDGESSRHGLYGKGGNEDRLRSREVLV